MWDDERWESLRGVMSLWAIRGGRWGARVVGVRMIACWARARIASRSLRCNALPTLIR